ncbi:hypothetical protein NDU88_001285 [Pleurodeles waltl]|uniref:Uncharacterized protein n=1 Tax=Pleurodeles waltl TaxID=8319 RepID=A0AAV7RAD3_PLEWA|nr:hypothetical protein NDU88_001285 [Pleurodeles waltl]
MKSPGSWAGSIESPGSWAGSIESPGSWAGSMKSPGSWAGKAKKFRLGSPRALKSNLLLLDFVFQYSINQQRDSKVLHHNSF